MKRMRMKKLSLLLTLFIFVSLVSRGQENPLDTLVSKFRQYRERSLQEKVYAQLDRTSYLTGETMWFKIYSIDGSFHRPLDLSKVAYAEVLDKGNFAVLQAKIELKNGTGNGSFFLPASLNSGNYRLRIYTNWMKNFSPEFYFDEVITIVNPFVSPEAIQRPAAKYSVDFFPEGGNLVAGINSKVAFKIVDADGRGSDGRGFLLNDKGDTVTAFRPEKYGIGSFSFTPHEGTQYRAVLVDADGKKTMHAITDVHRDGYVMTLRDTAGLLKVIVRSKGVSDLRTYLFVHARHIIARAERQSFENNSATFLLEKKDLPPGISHFTVFNEQLKPVCERLYFTPPEKKLDVSIATNAKVYRYRQRVAVTLTTTAEGKAAAAANLSLSVFKTDSLSTHTRAGIYPYVWLTSDLRGEVEDPAYYFASNEAGVVTAMDNLMLTHGWRKFDWKDILENDHAYAFLPEIKGHIINGVVTRAGETQSSVFTYLGSPGKIIRAYGSWSNAQGEVRFEIKDFFGSRRIIVQTKTDSAERYEVKILDPFSGAMDQQKLPALTLDAKKEKELLSRSIAMQVQDIYYYDETRNLFSKRAVDSSAFYGRADATYLLDDYTRFPVMEEVMREYVPGVFVRKRKDGFHFLVVNSNGGILPGDPMVLVDGIPVFDVDDVMSMDPLRVRKLEVVKRQYYLGHAVFSGIVSYSTYHGDLGGLELDPRSISLDYDGLQLQRQFYSPRYNNKDSNNRLPDQRYLLHWQPELFTDGQGNQKIEFYTSDVAGNYTVVAEGLTKDGFSGSQVITFSVEPSDNP